MKPEKTAPPELLEKTSFLVHRKRAREPFAAHHSERERGVVL